MSHRRGECKKRWRFLAFEFSYESSLLLAERFTHGFAPFGLDADIIPVRDWHIRCVKDGRRKIMKILIAASHILAAVSLATLLAGCRQANSASGDPLPRAKVVENLSPIVDMEQRGMQLTMAMRNLPLVATVSPDDARAIKEYYDVYYVYHNAAATSLAEGNMQAYRHHVEAGSKELDSLEVKLKEILKRSSGGNGDNKAAPEAKSGAL